MPEWEAEIAIDEGLVRALLSDQFPELDAASARPLAEGWDNSVWVVEDEWAFRFPRREIAIPGVERELEVLPRIAALLAVPVPVPVPVFVGHRSELFPWPFFGCRLLPGNEPAAVVIREEARARLGGELGRFLRRLHAPETDAAIDPERTLPVDPNRRADMTARVPIARRWLSELESLGSWRAPDSVERLLENAWELPPPAAEAVVHGDLHLRHVLLDRRGSLSGVIDWGDVCRADPAVDLSLVWSLLTPAGREAFAHEYGPIGDDGRLRARVLALALCAALAAYGRHEGVASVEREALAGLERTLVE